MKHIIPTATLLTVIALSACSKRPTTSESDDRVKTLEAELAKLKESKSATPAPQTAPTPNPMPSERIARGILESRIQQNANGCVTLIACDKTNGMSREFFGQSVYELECEARVEFTRDCGWDWDENFQTNTEPLSRYLIIQPDHTLKTSPDEPSNMISTAPMRHYWRKGDKAKLTGIKFNFEKTERGWRDQNGNLHQ